MKRVKKERRKERKKIRKKERKKNIRSDQNRAEQTLTRINVRT